MLCKAFATLGRGESDFDAQTWLDAAVALGPDTDAATRILVNDFHELFNRVLAVADNMSRHALRGSNQFAVDEQLAGTQREIDVTGDAALR